MSSDAAHANRLPRRAAGLAVTWWVAAMLFVFGCKSKPDSIQVAPTDDKLVVFAAASLRSTFTTMGDAFRRQHPNVKLEFNFAGTQELRTQLEQGAEADVFASADQRHMAELVKAGRVDQPRVFAKNEPVLAVAKESADRIASLRDLPNANRIVVGTPEVPIGRYTLQILDRAGKSLGADFRARVEAHVISRELNVRQIYSKVSIGEADVGIVYRTDVQGSDTGVKLVPIPPEINVIAEYPIGIVSHTKHAALAKSWLDFVLSSEGQRRLQKAGFSRP